MKARLNCLCGHGESCRHCETVFRDSPTCLTIADWERAVPVSLEEMRTVVPATKSCFKCRYCTDIVQMEADEKLFSCSVPLPPWRSRASATVSTRQEWCYDEVGVFTNRDIPSGDAMAEFCRYYDEDKP